MVLQSFYEKLTAFIQYMKTIDTTTNSTTKKGWNIYFKYWVLLNVHSLWNVIDLNDIGIEYVCIMKR